MVPLPVLLNSVIPISPEYKLALPVWFAFRILAGIVGASNSSQVCEGNGLLGDLSDPKGPTGY